MSLRRSYLALLLAAALVGAGCGDSDSEKPASSASSQDAKALLDKAFSTRVPSAEVDIRAKANLDGVRGVNGPISMKVSGPYASQGEGKLPVVDWDVTAEGAGQKLTGGLIVTTDNAFIEFQGQAYELGHQLFSTIKSAMAEAPKSDESTALRKLGIDPAKWLTDARVEDGGEIGGDPVQRVTGKVNADAVVNDVFTAANSAELRKQLEKSGQPVPGLPKLSEKQRDEIADSIKSANVTVDIDQKNRVRGVGAAIEFKINDAPEGKLNGGTIDFDYKLPKVDVSPDVKAPANPKPLISLLAGLGFGGIPGFSP